MKKHGKNRADMDEMLRNGLDEAAARKIYALGEEAVIWAMMQLAAMAKLQVDGDVNTDEQATCDDSDAADVHPSTPSASVPTYLKTPAKKRKKKPGAKVGHAGSRRPAPEEITRKESHRASCCPDCGGKLRRRESARTRYVEDIPGNITPEITEHTIHRDYCPHCKKIVEPPVPDAMPGATIGHYAIVLSAFLHYQTGVSVAKIVEIFSTQFHFKISEGGLMDAWRRLAGALEPWYEQIGVSARSAAVLHADETGWRVNGKTHWLWCFATSDAAYYIIDQSRAGPVVLRFLRRVFKGVLVTDFYGAYNAVACGGKQKCFAHLLRELKKVSKYKDTSGDWAEFEKRLKRLLRDGLRLCGRKPVTAAETYARRCARLEKRLDAMLAESWQNANARRLVKRLRRHRSEIFPFLYRDDVPADNNHAERTIRNAVLLRKTTLCNRSLDGAATQSILMSVFQTLRLRHHPGPSPIVTALRSCLLNNSLPDLPVKNGQTGE